MRTAETKTSATMARQNAPFFAKGEESFFGKSSETDSFFSQPSPPIVQTKLTVGQPGDRYEVEADAMADQVVQRLGDHAFSGGKNNLMPFFTKSITPLQRKCAECEQEENLQKKSETLSPQTASPTIESSLHSSKGSGNPLPTATRTQMESSFGADFSEVRLHTDSSAAQMNKELHAHAFTHGSDIYFNEGKYDTNSRSGQHLLAHELTHTLQQNGIGRQREGKDGSTSTGKGKEPLISTMPRLSTFPAHVQRVHIENGRKKFDCPDFAGDAKLESCLNDEDRLRPLETGESVVKIQKGLQKDGLALGTDGTKGVYGADTGKAVMAFKQKHNLGSTQFPDVGPGTTKKLDELCVGSPKPPKPKPPKPELPTNCGPGTLNPFCLPIPATDAPCQPFPDIVSAEVLRNSMSIAIPLGTASDTLCPEVKPVWETYFAATSKPFSFSNTSSCVVNAAKTDRDASSEANRIAKGHLEDILNNLPITLRGVAPSPFPFPGKPLAERRMPLEDAISPKIRGFLHHPSIIYNDKHNAAANIAGGVGINGEGSDIFGDDDRLVGGTVIIEVDTIDPTSGRMTGQVRWQPHVHVKDTVDFCPGNLTNSIILREFTVPMSKLEAMGLTRDVPITIDYDLETQQANFSVLPAFGPSPSNP